jgi:two-component system, NtrC family, response regulator AtoC
LRRIVVTSRESEIQQLARQVGQEIFVADNINETLDITETVQPDLIIFDHNFTSEHIRHFLNTIKNPNIPVVIAGTDESNHTTIAEFIKIGVYDYLKGKKEHHRLHQIVNQIESQINHADKNEDRFFADTFAASIPIVGYSQAMQNTLRMIKLVASSRCNPVLITGETGTGKELVAKAVHTMRTPEQPFVAVNCAALTTNLLESELFGHVKGAFTGADKEKTGLLEFAGNGTVFLDEISEMPMDLQAKLLRVLQEKIFRKVGGIITITCNATIIASSNRNLKKEVDANNFRRDLYYRLNICPITIAPLRSHHRKNDIQLLAEYFLRTSTICPQKSGKIKSLTKLAVETLEKHDWPGNVRELSNVIERAILLETTDKIGLSSIVINTDHCDQHLEIPKKDNINDFSLEKAERELITRALQETGWQKTRAANLLGINRATLYAKVKQYNLEKQISSEEESQNRHLAIVAV